MTEALRILLVGNFSADGPDEALDPAALRLALAASGLSFDLLSVEGYEAGLHALSHNTFDCALMDWRVSDDEGLTLLDRMRLEQPTTPIIVLTSVDDEALATRVLQLGAQDYLHSVEINAKNLSRSIRYAIERHRITREIEETRARLEELASRDPLTNLLNRRGLEESLQRLLRAKAPPGVDTFALLLDLDDFKSINDRFGFVTGDIVLKEIARNLFKSMRQTDYLGRVGRDEFLIFLPRTGLAEALKVADRLRLIVGDCPILLPSGQVRLTASAGVAPVTATTVSMAEVLYAAGQALSHSKRAGKNQTSLHTLNEQSQDEDLSVGEIVARLCRGEGLRCVKQIIVNIHDEATIGHELLSRGPAGPFEAPYDFFRLCIEQSVLNLVDLKCAQACVEEARRLNLDGRIHINLFPSTILDTPPDKLAELFPQDLPGQFCVELSEQQIIGDATDLLEHVQRLRDGNVTLALDDVGFGRSSLESLVVLEPDIVKIDRKWVTDAGQNPERLRVLERLIKVSQSLGAELVAEGIETRADLELLKGLGVEFGQGWYWGKPA